MALGGAVTSSQVDTYLSGQRYSFSRPIGNNDVANYKIYHTEQVVQLLILVKRSMTTIITQGIS